jgi:hypothetical protein
MMDFAAALSSDSVRRQYEAALLLHIEGDLAIVHLPALLACCKGVRLDRDLLSTDEQNLVECGAVKLAFIIGCVGLDPSKPVHLEVMRWLFDSVHSSNLGLAASAICALGFVGSDKENIVRCLQSVIRADLREVEHEYITLRALALRTLGRIDKKLASQYLSSEACFELRRASEYWQKDGPSEWVAKDLDWLSN